MASINATILLIEDHRTLAETVIDYLATAGFSVDFAADGKAGFQFASEQEYDAIILDIMLPGMDGFEICQKLRTELAVITPVLMLTARDQLSDKLKGFQTGADDYLVKPFELAELEARLLALIKRSRGEVGEQLLQVADLVLDTRAMSVRRSDQPIKLSATLFRILKILMRESPNLVTREAIERELWGDLVPDSDTLRSHLYKLRKVIDKPFEKPLMHTVQGVGFKVADLSDGEE